MKNASVILILTVMLLFSSIASAANFYIIPDSDTRLLTETELWGWDYETLGYALNEIFARHGYQFQQNGIYDSYFSQQEWYEPNYRYTSNSELMEKELNSVEWKNERLIKEVRNEMKEKGTNNANRLHLADVRSVVSNDNTILYPYYVKLSNGQRLNVYSAPSYDAYRGANGKAMLNTSEGIYVFGWDYGWLMVMYYTNNGAMRVGYVSVNEMRDSVDISRLNFEYSDAVITRTSVLTDDPEMASTQLTRLSKGTQVLYLATYYRDYQWAYVEVEVNGQIMRGFIPAESISY